MSKEQGNQPTEVYIAFVNHDAPKASRYVEPFFRKMETVLTEDTEASGIIFAEQVGIPPLITAVMKELTARGVPYSDVEAQFSFIGEHRREPTVSEQKKEKKSWLAQQKPFATAESRAFDKLITVFPHRVHVAMEATPMEQIEEINNGRFSRRREAIDQGFRLAFNGRLEEALPLYREGVEQFAELQRLRNRQIADVIEDEISIDTPPRILQGFLGEGHTQVYHLLRREGVSVTPVFPERVDREQKGNGTGSFSEKLHRVLGKFIPRLQVSQEPQGQEESRKVNVFSPRDAIIRKLIFYPNKPVSEIEWKQSLLLYTLYRQNIVMNDSNLLDRKFTEQEICEYTWKAKKHFETPEQIQNFQADMGKTGFFEAFNNLFPELRQPQE